MVKASNAIPFMLAVSALWGSSYVFTKGLTNALPPFAAFFLSNLCGALFFTILFARRLRGFPWRRLGALVTLNAFCVLNALLNVVGLRYTTSTNASFLVQFSVLLIPLFTAVARRERPRSHVFPCAMLALVGTAVLLLDFGQVSVNPGDVLILVVAASFSVYVVLLSVKGQGLRLVDILAVYYAMCVPIGGVLYFCLERGRMALPAVGDMPWLPLLGSATVILFAQVLQVAVSRFLRTETIALLCCVEPIITAGLAYFLLAERFRTQTWAGGLIVLASLVLANVFDRRADRLALSAAGDSEKLEIPS